MAKQGEIPEDRCEFELSFEDSEMDDRDRWHERIEAVCCWRKTWRDTERCIWHAEVNDKPINYLKESRGDNPERLDGAYLVGVEATSSISFRGCGLRAAIFWGANFPEADFHGTNLPEAKFHYADLSEAEFHNANLRYTRFDNAILLEAEFHNANLLLAKFHNVALLGAKFHSAILTRVEFYNSKLTFVEFHDAKLINAQFYDSNLYRAKFQGADFSGKDPRVLSLGGTDYSSAKFHNTDLLHAVFHGAQLSNVEFHHTDVSGADYTDADARNADFTHTILHDALFTRTDCRGTTFTNALLYETVFVDTRINSQTTFYNPEATFYDSITSRPAVVYEENRLTADDLPEDTHPLEAAEWAYRRLEKLHDENALSEEARKYHISKQEAQRAYQWEQGEYATYFVSWLQWHLSRHGESLAQILKSSMGLILVCGVLYPFAGGFESSSNDMAYRLQPSLTGLSWDAALDGIATLLHSIYFSVITFTTIGYGDLYPTGAGSKLLVGFESLSGAILIALFVFVLGRRVAR